MSAEYFLGIDIGTYSSKGVLVKDTGEVVANCTVEHTLEMPHPGWAEHDAESTWWNDFLKIVNSLLQSSGISSRQIAAAGFSAISSAVLPIDQVGRPLRKAILYGIDTRATKEIADLQRIIDDDAELCKSGVRLSAQSASPKVLWIRRNEPKVWSKTHLVVNGSGFLLYRLTGETAIDIYNAISFAPFVDFENERYTASMSQYVTPLERLPRLKWTCEIAGKVTPEGSRLSGLVEGTPIITGTADAAAEAISAGLTNLGDMMVMYGSSIFFILRTPQIYNTPYFWGARFLEPGTYVLAGGMATSGSLTRWFRDQFAPHELQSEKAGGVNAYAALARLASNSPIGGKGLVVLPYFAGERTPLFDPDAKGIILGLELRHTRGDIYRALLESAGYGIRHNIDKMKEEGAQPKRILAVGGGTYNPLWMQIVSNIAGIEQYIPEQQIGASYGDAFLAGIGVGRFSSTAEAARWVKIDQVIKPDSEAHKKYEDFYQIYRELYICNRHLMQQLSKLNQADGPLLGEGG